MNNWTSKEISLAEIQIVTQFGSFTPLMELLEIVPRSLLFTPLMKLVKQLLPYQISRFNLQRHANKPKQ